MFSFWSNDEEDCGENSKKETAEKEQRKPERFRYVSNRAERNTINTSNSGQLPGDVLHNNRCVEAYKGKRKQMDDMLRDVWSVRKDVRVNALKAPDIGQKSYYSRHGGVAGLHRTETNLGKAIPSGSSTTKTWSLPRQGYTCTEEAALNEVDILGCDNGISDNENSIVHAENHNSDIQKRNIANSLKRGVVGPNVTKRELSARTKRAQKFNNAYLRSTGMGMYTPNAPKKSNHWDNKHWNS